MTTFSLPPSEDAPFVAALESVAFATHPTRFHLLPSVLVRRYSRGASHHRKPLRLIKTKRRAAISEGSATLSATIGGAAGLWSRSFAMLVPEPSDVLTLDILGAVGLDLFFRGQSVWHISLDGSAIQLRRAAFWDMVERDRWSLTLPRPTGTDTIKALGDEVLSLTIWAGPETPSPGRRPLSFMGLSPSLLADIEATVSGALPWAGKGQLPIPATIPEEQQTKAVQGLRTGSLAVVTSKKDYGHHTGGPVLNSSALT